MWIITRCCYVLKVRLHLVPCVPYSRTFFGTHAFGGVVYIMRQHPVAFTYNLWLCCRPNLARLNTRWHKRITGYFPRSDVCLPVGPTHPPAQPSSHSYPESIEKKQHHFQHLRIPWCQHFLGENCWFGLRDCAAGWGWDWPQRLRGFTEAGWIRTRDKDLMTQYEFFSNLVMNVQINIWRCGFYIGATTHSLLCSALHIDVTGLHTFTINPGTNGLR